MIGTTVDALPMLDEAGLVACLATQQDIAAAYLFGSLAQGTATPHSDVDIAILLALSDDQEQLAMRRLELIAGLSPYANRQMDVVVLNQASLLLRHEVLLHGRRLYEGNRLKRVEFEVRTHKLFNDVRPMMDYFNQDLLQKIKEGKFARRRQRNS
jgi:uncharacterized protein